MKRVAAGGALLLIFLATMLPWDMTLGYPWYTALLLDLGMIGALGGFAILVAWLMFVAIGKG